uniref:Uncharacterized protein n=1 Tax=Megaselia scalaris TaxID=36166 RepID=T1H2D0_MEGSC
MKSLCNGKISSKNYLTAMTVVLPLKEISPRSFKTTKKSLNQQELKWIKLCRFKNNKSADPEVEGPPLVDLGILLQGGYE